MAISYLTFFLAMSIIGTIFFWTVYPYKILDIKGKYKVLTPTVKPGQELMFQRNVDKLVGIQGDVNCSFVDGIEYKLPMRRSLTLKGQDNSIQSVIVPKQIIPGKYKYSCHITFQVNPIHTVVYYLETEQFEVIQ